MLILSLSVLSWPVLSSKPGSSLRGAPE